MARSAGRGVQCVVCAAVGQFDEGDDGFLVCAVCGTQAANVANEVADLPDTAGPGSATRLRIRKAQPLAKGEDADGGKGRPKRPRNTTPPPLAAAAAAQPVAVRDSEDACLRVATALLRAQVRALAAATGEHWLEREVKRLWARFAATLVAPENQARRRRRGMGKAPAKPASAAAGDDGQGGAAGAASAAAGDGATAGENESGDDGDDDGGGGGSARLAALPPLEHLLALCCIALRQSRSAVLVPEVVKLCLTGRVPFYGAFDALGDAALQASIGSAYYDQLRPRRVLTCRSLSTAVDKVMAVLSIDRLAPLNAQAAVRRYCCDLKASSSVRIAAMRLAAAVPPSRWCSEFSTCARPPASAFPASVIAITYVFVALKCAHGLDGGGAGGVVAAAGLAGDAADASGGSGTLFDWLESVGEHRLGDGPDDVVAWSAASTTAIVANARAANQHLVTTRTWQSLGSCYADASQWATTVEIPGDRRAAYLEWAANVLVPESRRGAFRQRHYQQLHDFGKTFGSLARAWSNDGGRSATPAPTANANAGLADGHAVGASAAGPADAAQASASTGASASASAGPASFGDSGVVTNGDESEAERGSPPGGGSAGGAPGGGEPRYTRIGHVANELGGARFPESLRAVVHVLASHVLERDALLCQALHTFEAKALRSAQ